MPHFTQEVKTAENKIKLPWIVVHSVRMLTETHKKKMTRGNLKLLVKTGKYPCGFGDLGYIRGQKHHTHRKNILVTLEYSHVQSKL